MKKRVRDHLLEYRLTDVLEMTYSKNRSTLQKIKRELLNGSVKDSNLYPLSSFILGNALVVIQNGHSKPIARFYLLNPHRQSFHHWRLEKGTSPIQK